MAYVTRYRISLNVTVSADASQAFYTPPVNGYFEAFALYQSTNVPLATDANLLLTDEVTGMTIGGPVSATNSSGTLGILYSPRRVVHNQGAGSATQVMLVAVGNPLTGDSRYPLDGRIKIQVTSAGAATNFSTDNYLYVWVDGAAKPSGGTS